MKVQYHYGRERGRLCIRFTPEPFDGDPGLREIFFDGINEPLSGDALGLAAWLLLGRFVSRRMAFPKPLTLPLANQIVKTWGSTLELQPVDDEPGRFPPRAGSLVVEAGAGPDEAVVNEVAVSPVYRFAMLPMGGSGTSYAAGSVQARTNVPLLGQGVNGPGFGGVLASAVVYADFLGISDVIVGGASIDGHPPAKVATGANRGAVWRDLLKHAGFNLRVVGESA